MYAYGSWSENNLVFEHNKKASVDVATNRCEDTTRIITTPRQLLSKQYFPTSVYCAIYNMATHFSYFKTYFYNLITVINSVSQS